MELYLKQVTSLAQAQQEGRCKPVMSKSSLKERFKRGSNLSSLWTSGETTPSHASTRADEKSYTRSPSATVSSSTDSSEEATAIDDKIEHMTLRHMKQETRMKQLHRQQNTDHANSWDDEKVRLYEAHLQNVRRERAQDASVMRVLLSSVVSEDPDTVYRTASVAAQQEHERKGLRMRDDQERESLRMRLEHEEEMEALAEQHMAEAGKGEEDERSSSIGHKRRWKDRVSGLWKA